MSRGVKVANLLDLSDASDLYNYSAFSPPASLTGDDEDGANDESREPNLPSVAGIPGSVAGNFPGAHLRPRVSSSDPNELGNGGNDDPLNSTVSSNVGDDADFKFKSQPSSSSLAAVGKLINISNVTETSVHFSCASSSSSSLEQSFNQDPIVSGGLSPPRATSGEGSSGIDGDSFRKSFGTPVAGTTDGFSAVVSNVSHNPSASPPFPAAPQPPAPVSIYDAVFEACDVELTGRVRVPDLIQYITDISNADGQQLARLEELQRRLDPLGRNASVDAATFRREAVKWTNDIQEDDDDDDDKDVVSRGGGVNGRGPRGRSNVDVGREQRRKSIHDLTQSILTSPQLNSSILGKSGLFNESIVNFADTSLVASGVGGDDDDEDDGRRRDDVGVESGVGESVAAEFAARDRAIYALQEENAGLKRQLEQADDVAQGLMVKERQLTEKNKSLLHNLDKYEETRKKLEDLTDDIRAAEEEKEEEAKKRRQWESTAAALKKELAEVKEELEDAKRDCRSLEEEAAEIGRVKKQLDKEMAEYENAFRDLRQRLDSTEADLQRVVEEKQAAEADLIDAKMELTSLKSLESLSKELDEYFDDPRRKTGGGGGRRGVDDDGVFGGDITENGEEDGMFGLSTIDDDFSVGMTSADCSIVASPIADVVFDRRISAASGVSAARAMRNSIHEELCGVVERSLRDDPTSEVPLLGLEKTRLSLTTAEIGGGDHVMGNERASDDSATELKRNAFLKRAVMDDWDFVCDRTGDLTNEGAGGDSRGGFDVDHTGSPSTAETDRTAEDDNTAEFEDSPSVYVNSIFNDAAADTMHDIKSRFVHVLRGKKALEKKYFSLVRSVDLLANAVANIRDCNGPDGNHVSGNFNYNNNNNNNAEDVSVTDLTHFLEIDFEEEEEEEEEKSGKGEEKNGGGVGRADNSVGGGSDSVGRGDDTFSHCVSAFRLIRDFVKELIRDNVAICGGHSVFSFSTSGAVPETAHSLIPSRYLRCISVASDASGVRRRAINGVVNGGEDEALGSLHQLDISEIGSCGRRPEVFGGAEPESANELLYGTDRGASVTQTPIGEKATDRRSFGSDYREKKPSYSTCESTSGRENDDDDDDDDDDDVNNNEKDVLDNNDVAATSPKKHTTWQGCRFCRCG